MWTTEVSTMHSWWSVGTHCHDCMVLRQWNHITMNRPSISSRCELYLFCKFWHFLLLPLIFLSWKLFLITNFLRKVCSAKQNWERKTSYVPARRMQYLRWPIVRRIQGSFELYTTWYISYGSRFVFPLPENGQEAFTFKLSWFYQQRSFVSMTIVLVWQYFFFFLFFCFLLVSMFVYIYTRGNINHQSQRSEYKISILGRK